MSTQDRKINVGDYVLLDSKSLSGDKWVTVEAVRLDTTATYAHIEEGMGQSFSDLLKGKKAKPYKEKRPDRVHLPSSMIPTNWVRVLPSDVQERLRDFDARKKAIDEERKTFLRSIIEAKDYYAWEQPKPEDFPFVLNRERSSWTHTICGQTGIKGGDLVSHAKACGEALNR